MKSKSVLFTLFILVCLLAVTLTLGVYDETHMASAVLDTTLRVYVTDLNGSPLSNAFVSIPEHKLDFYTDNRGYTPQIVLKRNTIDDKNWFTVTVTVMLDGYVDTALFGCVIKDNAERALQIRLYADDQSNLPFVSYVETPPPEYIYSLFH